jgi:hypothetical protein
VERPSGRWSRFVATGTAKATVGEDGRRRKRVVKSLGTENLEVAGSADLPSRCCSRRSSIESRRSSAPKLRSQVPPLWYDQIMQAGQRSWIVAQSNHPIRPRLARPKAAPAKWRPVRRTRRQGRTPGSRQQPHGTRQARRRSASATVWNRGGAMRRTASEFSVRRPTCVRSRRTISALSPRSGLSPPRPSRSCYSAKFCVAYASATRSPSLDLNARPTSTRGLPMPATT